MPVIIAMTKTKDAARIGNNFAQSTWYSLKKIKDVELKKGDVVELDFEKEGRENVITKITVTGQTPAPSTPTNDGGASTKSNWRSKSPEESEIIRKQSVGKMVPEAMKAMDLTGLAIADVVPIIQELFKTFDELTK